MNYPKKMNSILGMAVVMAAAMTLVCGETTLKIETIKSGSGISAEPGKKVTVHYSGFLKNGSKFDSSLDRNQPFSFMLGSGQVIKGWDEGVKGMKIGEVRKLTIPPQMGYGNRQVGPIPPDSTLIFEVTLLGVE